MCSDNTGGRGCPVNLKSNEVASEGGGAFLQTDSACLLENALLLHQLMLVQEEMENLYLENMQLKARFYPGMTSAVSRVKEEFPYQLGSEFIASLKTVWKLFFLPVVFRSVQRKHQAQQSRYPEHMPAISTLPDFSESNKAKRHLSYRIGVAWIATVRYPLGFVFLPFALAKAYLAYRQDRKTGGK